jgi:predicted MFS family arabinose efflux permease
MSKDGLTDAEHLSHRQVLVMAVACAFAIATLYYNQPLLPLIRATFGITDYLASTTVTVGQLGYALGLLLFVPIGDRVDRRHLILALLLANTASLAACIVAPNFTLFSFATFVAGLTTVTPQIVVPTVAGLASATRRGHVVGILLSGMSTGLLFGRTFSGVIGDLSGWRSVFALAIVFNVFLVAAIWRLLPRTSTTIDLSYPRLMRSLVKLAIEQPGSALRVRRAFSPSARSVACGQRWPRCWLKLPTISVRTSSGHSGSSALSASYRPRSSGGWPTALARGFCSAAQP